MKQEFKGHLLYPLPTILVGVNVKDKPNYLVIGYISPFDYGKYIFFSLAKKRYSRIGIHENKTFSVNIPSVELFKETDICGTKSGWNTDKSELFDSFYGEVKTAPMIKECPINMECEITNIIDHEENEGVLGRIVKTYVNPECLVEGKLDIQKVNPIIWSKGKGYNYYEIGKPICK
ncbi:flavin reductase family protein [Bacteroidota bacterium]